MMDVKISQSPSIGDGLACLFDAPAKNTYKMCFGKYWFSESLEFDGTVANYKQSDGDGEVTVEVSIVPDQSTMKRTTKDSVLAKVFRFLYSIKGHICQFLSQ